MVYGWGAGREQSFEGSEQRCDGTCQGLVAVVCEEQANPRRLRALEIGYCFDLEE